MRGQKGPDRRRPEERQIGGKNEDVVIGERGQDLPGGEDGVARAAALGLEDALRAVAAGFGLDGVTLCGRSRRSSGRA